MELSLYPTTVVDTLKRMRKLLLTPNTWIKRELHKVATQPDGTVLHQFCLVGALDKVGGRYNGHTAAQTQKLLSETENLLNALTNDKFGTRAISYNDRETTTNKDIINLIDNAIKVAEKKEASPA